MIRNENNLADDFFVWKLFISVDTHTFVNRT